MIKQIWRYLFFRKPTYYTSVESGTWFVWPLSYRVKIYDKNLEVAPDDRFKIHSLCYGFIDNYDSIYWDEINGWRDLV